MKVKRNKYEEFRYWCEQNGYEDLVSDDDYKLKSFNFRKYIMALDEYARFRNSFENESPWLTIKEAAARIKITPRTLSCYISRGLFPYYSSFSGTKRIHIDDLDRWLSSFRFGPETQQQKR